MSSKHIHLNQDGQNQNNTNSLDKNHRRGARLDVLVPNGFAPEIDILGSGSAWWLAVIKRDRLSDT